MKMPISPARTQCHNRRAGFTLTETIVALAMVAILAGTTAGALIRSLQTEEIGYLLLQQMQLMQTLCCEQTLGTPREDIIAMIPEDWTARFETAENHALPALSTSWSICILSPKTRASLEMRTAVLR